MKYILTESDNAFLGNLGLNDVQLSALIAFIEKVALNEVDIVLDEMKKN